ncbi:nicotinamide mononucleotide transporter family protein [Patescibacteria group bacterium]|nr:nicotinamide mononucleotide transporter family protein [Patescibacteria group bacterium]
MFLQEIVNTSPLELIAGFGYLGGHWLLSKKKIAGWVVKIIGGIAWIIFLLQNGNNIFGAVTVVVVVAMMYGFYKWKKDRYRQHTKIDTFFEILAILVAMFMILRFALSGVYNLSPIFEAIIVSAEILSTILLARRIIYGWYSCILMSLMAGILVIFINDDRALLLGILELASIYFYCQGIRNFSSK